MTLVFTKEAAEVWDPVDGSGNARGPDMLEMQTWGTEVEQFLAGVLTNTRLAKSGNYTLTNADKGKSVVFTGTADFTLTLSAASGYDDNFAVLLDNEGTAPWKISAAGQADRFLFPGEQAFIRNSNDVWRSNLDKIRFFLPTGATTIYVNASYGDDTASGMFNVAGVAKATMAAALLQARNRFDLQSGSASIKIKVTSNITESLSGLGPMVGGMLVNIEGDTTTPSNTTWTIPAGQVGLQCRDFIAFSVNGFKMVGAGSGASAFSADQDGILDVGNNMEYGDLSGGFQFIVSAGGYVSVAAGTHKISGDCLWPIYAANGGKISFTGTTFNIPSARTFSGFVYSDGGKVIFGAGCSVTGSGAGVASSGVPITQVNFGVVTTNGLTIPGSGTSVETILSQGWLKFPATQNPSSDANTLDDYEEGTFTPTLTFATPGDLTVGYTTQSGRYTKIGNLVTCYIELLTSTFTHTTASGNLTLGGLPFTPAVNSYAGGVRFGGVTKANYTSMSIIPLSSGTTANFNMSGSAQTPSPVSTADVPTAGTIRLAATFTYYA